MDTQSYSSNSVLFFSLVLLTGCGGAGTGSVAPPSGGNSSQTRLVSSVNPVVINQPTTLSATVEAAGTGTAATGSVLFYDGTAAIGDCTLASGTCSYGESCGTEEATMLLDNVNMDDAKNGVIYRVPARSFKYKIVQILDTSIRRADI